VIDPQQLTTMARTIEQAGPVERQPDPDEPRATRLYSTRKADDSSPVPERLLADLDKLAA